MDTKRLPLALELTKPVLLAGEETELHSQYDPKLQLSSQTRTQQKTTSFSALGVLSDISADVAIDDVVA